MMLSMIKVELGSKIKVNVRSLPKGASQMLMEALSIPNMEKEKMMNMNLWGWQRLPDLIALWDVVGEDLYMPRGFFDDFSDGMMMMGEELDIVDQTSFPTHNIDLGKKIDLRPWQIPQVEAICKHGSGIIKSPAGSGKTVSVLAAIQGLQVKSLVIVNTKDIIWQWQERVQGFWRDDIHIGQIGDNVFDISDSITIATAQTIHVRYDKLMADGFFDEFGFVCLDEMHHATAKTFNKIMDSFSSRYRIGVSATPDKTGEFALATGVIGPIVCDTKPRDVDILQMPTVVKIPTRFDVKLKSADSAKDASANYQQVIKALVTDVERNETITANIIANSGHHQLVISKRLAHLDIIAEMLQQANFKDPVVTIIGTDSSEHRRSAKALADDKPCVILSTLADEAMDIPRLDRLHLIYPQRNTGLVTQQVGRVERVHKDKKEALIFDYCDLNINSLKYQWRKRRFEVYEERGYKIRILNQKDILF